MLKFLKYVAVAKAIAIPPVFYKNSQAKNKKMQAS